MHAVGRARLPAALVALEIVSLAVAACGVLAPSPAALRVEYQAQPVDGRPPTADDLEAIRRVLAGRLEDTGVAAYDVRVEAADRLIVEAAVSGEAADEMRALLGITGRFDVVPLGQAQVAAGRRVDLAAFPPLFSGDRVDDATIGVDQSGQRTLDLVLDAEGRDLLAAYTTDHVGDYVALVLDGVVLSAPVIQSPILGGEVQISSGGVGGFELGDVQRLVTILRHGSLPLPLQEVAVKVEG